jgi:CRP-like cAMP-binding protein
VEIPHPITRQDLADLTGATLFTVSRLLARWEAGGIVASRRGRVAVLRRADIESLVEP